MIVPPHVCTWVKRRSNAPEEGATTTFEMASTKPEYCLLCWINTLSCYSTLSKTKLYNRDACKKPVPTIRNKYWITLKPKHQRAWLHTNIHIVPKYAINLSKRHPVRHCRCREDDSNNNDMCASLDRDCEWIHNTIYTNCCSVGSVRLDTEHTNKHTNHIWAALWSFGATVHVDSLKHCMECARTYPYVPVRMHATSPFNFSSHQHHIACSLARSLGQWGGHHRTNYVMQLFSVIITNLPTLLPVWLVVVAAWLVDWRIRSRTCIVHVSNMCA